MVLQHHRLAEIELAERAALGHEQQRRDLARHHQRGEHVGDGGEAGGLHQHDAAHAAHPGAGDDADRLLLARAWRSGEERVGVQRRDQRRQHAVGHIDREPDVIGLEARDHGLVPGRYARLAGHATRARVHSTVMQIRSWIISALAAAGGIAPMIAKAYPNRQNNSKKIPP